MTLPHVISIDPPGAKEIDDAIGARVTPTGWLVDICIPDVPMLVRRGSETDLYAQKSGMTTYTANSVRHSMLPHDIVNKLSLSPHENRPMIYVEIDISCKLQPKVINIRRIEHKTAAKMSYAEADAALRDPDHKYHKQLATLWDLTSRIQQERSASTGAVFDIDKGIVTDEEGRLITLEAERKHKSNLIVMEMMIMANSALATWAATYCKPVIYRNHILEGFTRGDRESSALELAEKERTGISVARQKLRSLQNLVRQAVLETTSKGHHGLDRKNYAWFTSPLRRYVDIVNLRSILSSDGNTEKYEFSRDMEELDRLSTRLTGLYRQKNEESSDYHAKKSRAQIANWINARQNERALDKYDIHTIVKALEENPVYDPLAVFDYIKSRLTRDDLSGRDIHSLLESSERLLGVKAYKEIAEWAQAPARSTLLGDFTKSSKTEQQEPVVDNTNYKGILLETAAIEKAKLTFSEAKRSGPSHAPVFTVEVKWTGIDTITAEANGRTLKAAEQKACSLIVKELEAMTKPANNAPVLANAGHPKNILLEMAARNQNIKLIFGSVSQSGLSHNPTFEVKVTFEYEGGKIVKTASGSNKKDAEKTACRLILEDLERASL